MIKFHDDAVFVPGGVGIQAIYPVFYHLKEHGDCFDMLLMICLTKEEAQKNIDDLVEMGDTHEDYHWEQWEASSPFKKEQNG